MLSIQQVLSTLKTQFDSVSCNNFLDIAPQSIAYPFVTYKVVSNPTEYTFGEVNEDIKIDISLFSNSGNITDIMNLANTAEGLLQDLNAGNIYCTHKDNEIGPYYMEKEHYWTHIMSYTFKYSRNK